MPFTSTLREMPTAVRLGPADGLDRDCVAPLDEPFHGVVETAVVDPTPAVGDTVYITTGLGDGWRVDAAADAPEWAATALPQIVELYARPGSARCPDPEPPAS